MKEIRRNPESGKNSAQFCRLFFTLAGTTPGVIGLRLYVETGNTRAQQTYEALGMVKPNYLVMEAMLSNSYAESNGES